VNRSAFFLILTGCLLLGYSIVPSGIGFSEDSISYLSAARSLHDAGSLRDIDGTAFVAWAPLFPAIIAAMEALPFNIEGSLAAFNVIMYILTAITAWALICGSMENTFWRTACLAAIIFSFTLLRVYTMAWSEGLFLLLVNVALILLCGYGEFNQSWRWIFLGLCMAAAMMLRYAGLFLIPAAVLSLLRTKSQKPQKTLFQLTLLLAGCLLPLAVWLIRNKLVSDTFTGFRPYDVSLFLKNITVLADTLTSWLLPVKVPLIVRVTLLVPLTYIVTLSLRPSAEDKRQDFIRQSLLTQASSLVSYLTMLLAAYALFSFEEPRDRMLAPVLVPVMILLFGGGETISKRFFRNRVILPFFVILWLGYPAARSLKHVQLWHHEGAGIYSHPSRKESEIISWLKENGLSGKVFSNDAAAIYYFTGMNASRIPKSLYSYEEFYKAAHDGSYLVWWNNREYYDLTLIHSHCALEKIAEFSEGTVFLIQVEERR